MITRWNLDELTHSEDELYHHGVMGMRWGHRKQEVSSGLKRTGQALKTIATHPGKSLNAMAHAPGRIARARANKTSRSGGRKFTPDVMVKSGKPLVGGHSGVSGFLNKASAKYELGKHNERKAYRQMDNKGMLKNSAIIGGVGAATGAIGGAVAGGSLRSAALGAATGGASTFIGALAGTSISRALLRNDSIYNFYKNRTDNVLKSHGYKRISK